MRIGICNYCHKRKRLAHGRKCGPTLTLTYKQRMEALEWVKSNASIKSVAVLSNADGRYFT